MKYSWLWALAMLAVGTVSGCGGKGTSGNNNNGIIVCENTEQCPPGYTCEGNICVPEGDGAIGDGSPGGPDISVDPGALDFGNPLLGVPVHQTVTVTNVGGANLTIFSIVLEEDGDLDEFIANPVGTVSQVLGPNESMDVDVELVNVDAQADTGRLIINSDDPDEAMVTVPLTSELKGDLDLGTCVMQSDSLFEDCVTNPEVIDYGDMAYDATALAEVSVFNADLSGGNRPLVVSDIYITNNSGYVSLFTLTIYRFIPDPNNPGQYLEEELTDFPSVPYLLNVDDGVDEPEALLLKVRFLAGLEGRPVPAEFLVIQSDDPDEPTYQIPFAGNIGCPAGYHECDGMAPWCEYQCTVTNNGVEACEGIDNDCDCVTDEGCPVCGNGIPETGEQCDDGDNDNNDSCPDDPNGTPPGTCQNAFCGDGYVWDTDGGTEGCDDGNQNNTDACPDDAANGGTCQPAFCGDGFVRAGVEQCDDGDQDNTDGCPDGPSGGTCQFAFCGDGFTYAGVEECDDGTGNSNTTPNACRMNCTEPVCGDDVHDDQYGEECDEGTAMPTSTCNADCTDALCGDGIIDDVEQCDDGVNNSNSIPDACRLDCRNPWCGDNVVDTGEECDPPNGTTCDDSCLSMFVADGTYTLNPTVFYQCAGGLVNLNYPQFVFIDDGNTLSVSPSMNGGCILTGPSAEANGGNINLMCVYAGTCNETYTLVGSFTSNDVWQATLTVTFSGMFCLDCTMQFWNLTGTRL